MRVITRTGRGDVPAVTEKHFRPATEKEFSKSAQRSTASSTAIAITAAVVSCTLLYWETLSRLVRNWIVDENYSHGFLIPPLAAYFIWERRGRLAETPVRPSNAGLLIVVGSLGVLFAGALGAEVFLSRISLLGVLAGSVVFLYGWARLRVVAFPLAFLLLMIPIPAILFNHLTLPLQLIASQLGERIVSACQIPVLREGNILVLPSTRLEVVEACSGIRSLMSLLTLGIVFCYFADSRPAVRVAVTAATIPIAIGTNGLRVAGTGVAAQYVGPEAAEGFFHTFSGWLVFLAAFAMMVLLHRAIVAIWPASRVEGSIR